MNKYFENILTKGVGVLKNLATIFFVIRSLSKSDYGLWGLLTTFEMILLMVISGLCFTPFVKFYSETKSISDKRSLLQSTAIITVSGTMIGLLLFYAGIYLSYKISLISIDHLMVKFLFLFGIMVFMRIIRQFWQNYLIAQIRTREILHITIAANLIYIGSITYLFLMGNSVLSLETLAIIYIFSDGIIFFFLLKDIKINIVPEPRNRLASWRIKILGFGRFTFASNSLAVLTSRTDAIMLPAFTSTTILGEYMAIKNIVDVVRNLTTAIVEIAFPKFSKNVIQEKFNDIKKSTLKYFLFLSFFYSLFILLVWLFGQNLLFLAYGIKYQHLSDLFLIFSFLPLVGIFGSIGSSITLAHNIPRQVLIGTIISFTINIILNLLLIPVLEAKGAALATICSVFIGGIYVFRFGWKKLG